MIRTADFVPYIIVITTMALAFVVSINHIDERVVQGALALLYVAGIFGAVGMLRRKVRQQ